MKKKKVTITFKKRIHKTKFKEKLVSLFTDSKVADKSFLGMCTMINLFAKTDKKMSDALFSSKDSINYLSLVYVEMLHELIIILYQRSDDPVIRGYMSKDNLEYTLDHVKYMYNNTKYKKIKLIKQTAFILYNIASKHPFTDGNKRTAIISCDAFLEYNGYTIGTLPFEKSKEFILQVAKGEKKEADCQKFVRQNILQLAIPKKTLEQLDKIKEKLIKLANEEGINF